MYKPRLKPQPLGKVVVPTPGTPVQLNSALVTAGLVASTDSILVNKVSLVAVPTNAGKVYVGTSDMNKTTLYGVLYVLQGATDSWQVTDNVGVNKYRFDQWYVDADNAGEGVYGSIDQE